MDPAPSTLRYGSVCSGIEAVSLAWQPLGLRPAWFSEIDPFANAVLEHHYPLVTNLGDMTRIAPQIRRGAVSAPEIFVGGPPCQSFSIAGMRRGLKDPRGTLTLTYVELADAIDETRISQQQPPAVCVWENVPGVLNDRGNAFGCFLGALCGEKRELQPPGERWTNAGCVYGPARSVAWRVLDAQYFGVAQRRRRVFVGASARDDFSSAEVLFEQHCLRRDSAPGPQARQSLAGHIAPSSSRAGSAGTAQQSDAKMTLCFGSGNTSGPIERAACLTAHGSRMDFEGDTFPVQAIAGCVAHTLNSANKSKGSSEDGTGRGVPIVSMAYPSMRCAWPSNFAPVTVAFAENSRSEIRLENGDGQVAGSLSKGGGKPGQGAPVVASVSLRGRQRGVSAELGGDIAPALRASTGGSDKAHVLYPSVEAHFECVPCSHSNTENSDRYIEWRVRRLMPLECERLQGMPDDYTLVPFRGQLAADGPRYKAIGESMAVPCMTWIGQRLLCALRRAAS